MKVGDQVQMVKGYAPLRPGDVVTVSRMASGGAFWGRQSPDGKEFALYESEVKPVWSLKDAKVGDRIKVIAEFVDEVAWVGPGYVAMVGDTYEFDDTHRKFELVEAAPGPKVGDDFTLGLPVGTVIEFKDKSATLFRTGKAWVMSGNGFAYEIAYEQALAPATIVYLP